jgi:hypothetical protein
MRCSLRRVLGLAPFLVFALACSGTSEGPQPRASDPPLTHSWTMPASASPIARVSLGTLPESNADEMMEGAVIAGLVHRVATRCARAQALPRAGTVVLRLAIDAGEPRAVEAEPASEGACLVRALKDGSESDALKSLPAGTALLHLQLHATDGA